MRILVLAVAVVALELPISPPSKSFDTNVCFGSFALTSGRCIHHPRSPFFRKGFFWTFNRFDPFPPAPLVVGDASCVRFPSAGCDFASSRASNSSNETAAPYPLRLTLTRIHLCAFPFQNYRKKRIFIVNEQRTRCADALLFKRCAAVEAAVACVHCVVLVPPLPDICIQIADGPHLRHLLLFWVDLLHLFPPKRLRFGTFHS